MNEEIQEIIRRGTSAKALLESEAFVTTINELSRTYQTAMFRTEPGQEKEREEIYYLHTALQQVFGAIQALVDAGEQAQAALNEMDEE